MTDIPGVGTPVTLRVGSDAYPYEVIAVGKDSAEIREVTPTGMSDASAGCYTETYIPKEDGEIVTLSCRGKHGWHVKGDYRGKSYGWCYKVRFGRAVYYQDPGF